MRDDRSPSPLTLPMQIGVGAIWLVNAAINIVLMPDQIRVWAEGPFIAGALTALILAALGIALRWRWFYYYTMIAFGLTPVSLLAETSSARVAFDVVAFLAAVVMLVASSYYSAAWAMYRFRRA